MIDEKLEAAARDLYNANENRVKPDWDQLGDVTKSVWRAYVNKDPNWPFKYSQGSERALIKAHAEPVLDLKVSLHTAVPPETQDVSGAGYARATAEAPLAELPAKPLTLKERLAMKGLK